MARKPRRTISMNSALYDRISAHSEAIGESRSGWAARVIEAALDAEGAPVVFDQPKPGKGGRPPLPRINGARVSPSPFVEAPACSSNTISTAPIVLDGHFGGVALL